VAQPNPATVYQSSAFVPPRPVSPPMPQPLPSVTPNQGDETPTVHTDDRKRGKRKWLFGGFGVFLLLIASLGAGATGTLRASSRLQNVVSVPVERSTGTGRTT